MPVFRVVTTLALVVVDLSIDVLPVYPQELMTLKRKDICAQNVNLLNDLNKGQQSPTSCTNLNLNLYAKI